METPPREVLSAWDLAEAVAEPVSIGLINRTFVLSLGPRRWVLQRLHPVFRPEVNVDIDAITRQLEAEGLCTPRLVPTRTGALWVDGPDGTWRLQTHVDGEIVDRVGTPDIAREAARMLGRFHGATRDLVHRFRFTRPGAHDTPRHLAHLRQALERHPDHRLSGEVRPVAEAILEAGDVLPPIPELPQRIIHGDPKITNVLFEPGFGRARALVDLDTLAHGTYAVELGDALRSWCNPGGEEAPDSAVRLDLFEAALDGWASEVRGFTTEDELAAIVPGVETIALELAARFCADALEERYFGWDARRFESLAHHDLVRARSQLALAVSVREARPALHAAVERSVAQGLGSTR